MSDFELRLADMVMREAGRLAGTEKTIKKEDIVAAIQAYRLVLSELRNHGLMKQPGR